jgi:hypothetical protein
MLGQPGDFIGEVDVSLVDDKLLEGECYESREEERRKWRIDRRRGRESGMGSRLCRLRLLSTFSALLLYSPLANRGDRI